MSVRIKSKVASIRELTVHAIKNGEPIRAARIMRTAAVTVIVADDGTIYSSRASNGYVVYDQRNGHMDSTIQALKRMGMLTAEAVAEHESDCKARRDHDVRRYHARNLLTGFKVLGIKPTTGQQTLINNILADDESEGDDD